MENGEIKNLLTEYGKAFEAFKDAHAESTKKRDALTEEKLARIGESLDALGEAKAKLEAGMKAAQERADDLEKKLNRPGGPSDKKAAEFEAELKSFNAEREAVATSNGTRHVAPVDAKALQDYKSAFARTLKSDPRALNGDEVKALQVGVQPDGGYLVPPDMSGRIVTRVFETSPIRQIANVQRIGGTELKGVTDRDEAGAIQWGSETTAPTESTTPQIGEWSIVAYEGRVEPKATQQMLEDASIDIEAWLARKVADKIGRGEAYSFVKGTGVDRPRGFATYTTAATADSSRAWGQMEHVKTGANGDFAASSPADVIFTLVGAMKPAYLPNARFVTTREVITKIRKFKGATTGDYLWQPGLTAGTPDRLLGYPITLAADLDALTTDSLSLAFGDFAEGYQIVDRVGMTTLRDPYTAKPYIKFYTRLRVGGAVINFDAIKFLKFAA